MTRCLPQPSPPPSAAPTSCAAPLPPPSPPAEAPHAWPGATSRRSCARPCYAPPAGGPARADAGSARYTRRARHYTTHTHTHAHAYARKHTHTHSHTHTHTQTLTLTHTHTHCVVLHSPVRSTRRPCPPPHGPPRSSAALPRTTFFGGVFEPRPTGSELRAMAGQDRGAPFLGPFSAVRLHTHGQTGRLLPVTAGAGGGGAPGAWNTGDATLAYLRQLQGYDSAPLLSQRPVPQADPSAPDACGQMPAARPPPPETDGENGACSAAWLAMEQVLENMQSAVREVSAASSREHAAVSQSIDTPLPAAVGAHTAQLDALEQSLEQVQSGLGVSPLPVTPPAPPCLSHVRGRLRVLRWKRERLTTDHHDFLVCFSARRRRVGRWPSSPTPSRAVLTGRREESGRQWGGSGRKTELRCGC